MSMRRIGFIGIGNMGWPMAANLARAGFEVVVFDARDELARSFVENHRATRAPSLNDVARLAECIITMLPDHTVVRQVILGDGADCVAGALEPGHLLVDMSTSDPTATRALAAALSLRGVHMVDAPVMGGVAFARDGSLDIMAGGDGEAIDLLEPVFAAMGRKVYRCGRLGSGHALKAINNFVNACALMSIVEGLAMGRKLGIDTGVMIETMQVMCTGRNHPIDKKVIPHILTRTYSTGMTLGFIAKDLRIAVDAAHGAGAPAPLAQQVCELWQRAGEALGLDRDQAEIVRYWEQASGVTL
ncbi:MAG: NAD(P)-dependent oxidoreductase [Burkholderiales bacterium]|nr:NAD(P)-dependent oxidoreductase [Burkholderiales bacterium]